ncbi:MAG: hypothetical protein A2X22_00330 [Bacteroidetes bacterium GWF2_49_14]|nr:MAG: hypothetical protein A2X22_00330 [Bacteroidetes bacterium GWF2_49_14]HBB91618.1 hypothetical protein [Bacteroidales bacterium]
MNIQAEKLRLVKLILETDNPNLIESIKRLFLKEYQQDFWETLSQVEQDDIIEGLKEIEAGNVVDYKEFMGKFK